MNTFYIYDGKNETGPFTVDELKQKGLTRTTPLRLKDTDNWLPAEKLPALKAFVVPPPIRKPQDVLPAIVYLHRRRPVVLYGVLLLLALLAGSWLYRPAKDTGKEGPEPAAALPVRQNTSLLPAPPSPVAMPAVAKEPVRPAAAAPAAKDDAARATRLHWNKLITVTNSNYGIGLLGGIKDLSVIVNNRTDYPLDEVVAKVTYFKAGGGVWKTKLITLHAVPPQESKDQPVPDAGRGKKVKVSLYKVVSKKMQLRYAEGGGGTPTGKE